MDQDPIYWSNKYEIMFENDFDVNLLLKRAMKCFWVFGTLWRVESPLWCHFSQILSDTLTWSGSTCQGPIKMVVPVRILFK